MERSQVVPPHAQTQLWLSFSDVLAYIFQFNLDGFNGIWSVPNVCAIAVQSPDLELQPEAAQKQTVQSCCHPCTQHL